MNLQVTWKELKERLTTKAEEIPLEKNYNLSADSLALLKWILELRSREFLLGRLRALRSR